MASTYSGAFSSPLKLPSGGILGGGLDTLTPTKYQYPRAAGSYGMDSLSPMKYTPGAIADYYDNAPLSARFPTNMTNASSNAALAPYGSHLAMPPQPSLNQPLTSPSRGPRDVQLPPTNSYVPQQLPFSRPFGGAALPSSSQYTPPAAFGPSMPSLYAPFNAIPEAPLGSDPNALYNRGSSTLQESFNPMEQFQSGPATLPYGGMPSSASLPQQLTSGFPNATIPSLPLQQSLLPTVPYTQPTSFPSFAAPPSGVAMFPSSAMSSYAGADPSYSPFPSFPQQPFTQFSPMSSLPMGTSFPTNVPTTIATPTGSRVIIDVESTAESLMGGTLRLCSDEDIEHAFATTLQLLKLDIVPSLKPNAEGQVKVAIPFCGAFTECRIFDAFLKLILPSLQNVSTIDVHAFDSFQTADYNVSQVEEHKTIKYRTSHLNLHFQIMEPVDLSLAIHPPVSQPSSDSAIRNVITNSKVTIFFMFAQAEKEALEVICESLEYTCNARQNPFAKAQFVPRGMPIDDLKKYNWLALVKKA